MGVSAFLIGLSKTGLPGIGILAVVAVAAVIPARASTGLILPMLIVADIFAVSHYHRHTAWKHLVRLLPCVVAGVVLGYLAMGRLSDDQVRRLIGGIVLGLLALNAWRTRTRSDDTAVPTAWWFPAGMGLLAGITTMLANAAGPIMIVYLLAMRLPKEEFVGTGAWYFLMVNCFKVPFSAHLGLITPASLNFNLVLLPLVIGGALAGIAVVKRLPEKQFNAIIQVLALAGAIFLLI